MSAVVRGTTNCRGQSRGNSEHFLFRIERPPPIWWRPVPATPRHTSPLLRLLPSGPDRIHSFSLRGTDTGHHYRHQPTNPPTHQPTNPPTHQPTNPPTHQPTNPPTHQPTNPPTHQPTNPPTHQPTNPPTHQPRRIIPVYRDGVNLEELLTEKIAVLPD